MIVVTVTGMDALRKALADVEVSPAIQESVSEARRQRNPMLEAAALGAALAAADVLIQRSHEWRMIEYNRRIAASVRDSS